jgi:hypothetical protein
MNTVQTLLIDLLPAHGSSVTACVSFRHAYNWGVLLTIRYIYRTI